MAPIVTSEAVAAPVGDDKELAKRREAEEWIRATGQSALGWAGLLLCSLFIPGVSRWLPPECPVFGIFATFATYGVYYVDQYGWHVPWSRTKSEPEETAADMC